MRFLKASLPVILFFFSLAVFAALGSTPASAETLQPWWHLRTSTRPTNIQPGTATDEVQQVTVAPGVNEYGLGRSGVGVYERYLVGAERTEAQEFTRGESADEIQA